MSMPRALEVFEATSWDEAMEGLKRIRNLLEPQGFKLTNGNFRFMRKADGKYLVMATLYLSCEGKPTRK